MGIAKRLMPVLAVLGAWVSPAAAVTIDPGQYTGRYFVVGVTGELHGPSTVNLAAGTYTLDTGASISGSGFVITVDAAGNVAVDSPAAVASGGALMFNNAMIDIKARTYTGRYFLSRSSRPHSLETRPSFFFRAWPTRWTTAPKWPIRPSSFRWMPQAT